MDGTTPLSSKALPGPALLLADGCDALLLLLDHDLGSWWPQRKALNPKARSLSGASSTRRESILMQQRPMPHPVSHGKGIECKTKTSELHASTLHASRETFCLARFAATSPLGINTCCALVGVLTSAARPDEAL